ncbi:MAG: hypothetical protein IT209_03645 [Armatimonadetes bacterium]|nr:hypothetical protein [Armatimonadota bacterium]
MGIMYCFAVVALMAMPARAFAGNPPQHPASLDVMDYGAKGDGKSDDTSAFQKAIDEANALGGCVVTVPRGDFLIKGHLTVKDNVVLKGVFEAPTARTQMKGSTLLAVEGAGSENGEPFITLKTNGTLKGLTIHYPEQSSDSPKPYPWTVRGDGDNCSIVDVLMTNPWNAVDFGTLPAGRHYIKGLYAQPLHTGIFIDKCFDVGRVEDVHLWPFWDVSEKMQKYLAANATAFVIGRTDWEYMLNCFCIFYKVGFHFVANADGPGNCVILNSGSDVGPTAVLVDAVQDHAGVAFTNCQFMTGVRISPGNKGPVKFTSCGFWGIPGAKNHAVLEGQGQTSFVNCHFTWAHYDNSAPTILAKGGGLLVNGCDFMDSEKTQIVLEKGVESAIITSNRLRGGEKITNNTEGDVQIGLNSKK